MGPSKEDTNTAEKILLQQKYTEKNNTPLFAPIDGICWSCKEQIYTKISLEKAKTALITGCPHCSYSFVG